MYSFGSLFSDHHVKEYFFHVILLNIICNLTKYRIMVKNLNFLQCMCHNNKQFNKIRLWFLNSIRNGHWICLSQTSVDWCLSSYSPSPLSGPWGAGKVTWNNLSKSLMNVKSHTWFSRKQKGGNECMCSSLKPSWAEFVAACCNPAECVCRLTEQCALSLWLLNMEGLWEHSIGAVGQ